MIIPVILSGGAGSRLWPLSRQHYPKQLMPLIGGRTMLQETIRRLDGVPGLAGPIVVCNEQHRFMVAEQLRAQRIEPAAIILEPVGRNTAPAVAVAAAYAAAAAEGEEPVLLVLPADHVIRDRAALHEAIARGAALAGEGKLVTFGIVPDAAETGYGYIRAERSGTEPSAVVEFVEKPDADRARAYLASGDYFWNSGMFMFRAGGYLDELGRHSPEMVEACRAALSGASDDLDFTRLEASAFERCPSDSIDYAVMEKTGDAVVVPLSAGWSDVGSWSALHEVSEKDPADNVLVGDVVVEDARNCYVYSSDRLVTAVGLKDCVVIETPDAVLVAPRDRVQDVKKLVQRLKAGGREETANHRRVVRPWGSYDSIDLGERFQVKRIVVNPGAKLSLQMHHHRAEHWIVVQGTARVTRGDDEFLLGENESTYIPMGTTHRLENPGKVPLHLIEVQSGTYLGEDDIVRYDDTYGRAGEA
jgi:mannose-1-phosphate guanylyltransferase/mannose-6-phosphate isomerase